MTDESTTLPGCTNCAAASTEPTRDPAESLAQAEYQARITYRLPSARLETVFPLPSWLSAVAP